MDHIYLQSEEIHFSIQSFFTAYYVQVEGAENLFIILIAGGEGFYNQE